MPAVSGRTLLRAARALLTQPGLRALAYFCNGSAAALDDLALIETGRLIRTSACLLHHVDGNAKKVVAMLFVPVRDHLETVAFAHPSVRMQVPLTAGCLCAACDRGFCATPGEIRPRRQIIQRQWSAGDFMVARWGRRA